MTFMTVKSFLMSYDRDVLDLHDDPTSYITETETGLVQKHTTEFAFDKHGNTVWPLALLKAHLQIDGNPLWPEPPSLT